VAPAGTLGGNGVGTGPVILNGNISPGASVGTLGTGPQTWNGGGSFTMEVSNAVTVGGWDHLNVSGTIDVQATAGSPFAVRLVSLAGSTPGLASNWDYNQGTTWSLADATGGVLGFDATKFVIDTTRFSNDLAGGTFQLSSSLNVTFLPNHRPALLPADGSRLVGETLTRNIADFLDKLGSDPDNDPLGLVAVYGGTNGTVTTDGTNIIYTGTNNLPDVFYCVIRDVRSSYRAGDTVRMATNTYTVNISTNGPTPNITGQQLLPDGNVRISFATIPNRTYQVQATEYLTNPIPWVTVLITNSSTNGALIFDDLQATNYPQRYYRTAAP